MTLNYILFVNFQLSKFREVWRIYSLLLLPSPLRSGVVVTDWALITGQIDMSKIYSYSIETREKTTPWDTTTFESAHTMKMIPVPLSMQ